MITRKVFIRELIHVSILVIVGFCMTLLRYADPEKNFETREFLILGTFMSLLWILLWKGNEYVAHVVSQRISWIKYPLKRFVVGTIAMLLFTFGAMYVLTVLYETVFEINIGTGVFVSVVIAIVVSLFMHARQFLINWRGAAIRAEQYQKETLEAKYESLKQQVNPHFLFNSLNALSNLVYEDEVKAIRFLKELARMYQYVLDSQECEVVRVEEELAFLKSYLYLQQIRFDEKLSIETLDDVPGFGVAPLALQMLIENAIKHNVISSDRPLAISIRQDGDSLVIRNNLQRRMSQLEDSAGVGLENIRRRYNMLCGRAVVVEVSEHSFSVRLPLIKLPYESAGH